MLGQPDFLSQDMGIVVSLWCVLKIKVAVWLTMGHFNPAERSREKFSAEGECNGAVTKSGLGKTAKEPYNLVFHFLIQSCMGIKRSYL